MDESPLKMTSLRPEGKVVVAERAICAPLLNKVTESIFESTEIWADKAIEKNMEQSKSDILVIVFLNLAEIEKQEYNIPFVS